MVDLGEGPPSPLFWVKEEEMTEGGKAGRASKTNPGPLVSSWSGAAATDINTHRFVQL